MKIKIISNPYLKEILFQEWDDNTSRWIELCNSNSSLLTEKIKRGFFNFVVDDIIKCIITEYGPDPEDIAIVFEGVDDEWTELESICVKTGVKVARSGKYLDNAYEIFDGIKKKFDSIKVLANKGIHRTADAELQNEFKMFADAANDIKTIFNSKAFSYAKPIELIKLFINLIANKKGIILDFFAGSGTTLHATMQLNAEDGGHRQCILVTNNENNICEEVTYERNRRVIQGYTNAKGEEVAGLTKNNLRYYRTGFVGRNRSMQNMRKLVNLATDMLCIKEDLYTEQNTFGGQKTYKGIFRYFDDGKKQMLVIYREEAIDELVDIIYDMDIPQPIKVYVFSPSEDPWEGSFDDVSDKVELCALPQAIYNTYRRILPKKKDAIIAPEDDALATTQKDKDLFDGMLNFTDEEEA